MKSTIDEIHTDSTHLSSIVLSMETNKLISQIVSRHNIMIKLFYFKD